MILVGKLILSFVLTEMRHHMSRFSQSSTFFHVFAIWQITWLICVTTNIQTIMEAFGNEAYFSIFVADFSISKNMMPCLPLDSRTNGFSLATVLWIFHYVYEVVKAPTIYRSNKFLIFTSSDSYLFTSSDSYLFISSDSYIFTSFKFLYIYRFRFLYIHLLRFSYIHFFGFIYIQFFRFLYIRLFRFLYIHLFRFSYSPLQILIYSPLQILMFTSNKL